MSTACSSSVPTTTGSVASLPPGRTSLAVSFSGEGMGGPYPKIPLELLLQRHERRLTKRRAEPVREAKSDVRGAATAIETDVARHHVRRRRERPRVEVDAEHRLEHDFVARSESV